MRSVIQKNVCDLKDLIGYGDYKSDEEAKIVYTKRISGNNKSQRSNAENLDQFNS